MPSQENNTTREKKHLWREGEKGCENKGGERKWVRTKRGYVLSAEKAVQEKVAEKERANLYWW